MLVGGVINWKGESMANCNQALGDVRTGYGTRVSCTEENKDRLQSIVDRVTLLGHDLQAFHEVSFYIFNNHGVVVVLRENMAVDVQLIQGFATNTIELLSLSRTIVWQNL